MTPPIRFIQIVQNLPGTPVERGGGFSDQESRLMLDHAIEKGRGGMILNLTSKQYASLKRSKRALFLENGQCQT
jgi:hypothetical protein